MTNDEIEGIFDHLIQYERKPIQVRLRAGKYRVKADIWREGSRLYFKYPFNKSLTAEIKTLGGRKYHGFDDKPRKLWSAPLDARNRFQLTRMMGGNPYERFDTELKEYKPSRSLYEHQVDLVRHGLTRRFGIWAAEMGTGKSLAAIELAESLGYKNEEIWYIGPKAGVKAFTRELVKWESKIWPVKILTYDKFVSMMKSWIPGAEAPRMVIFDECSKIKNHSSQRSQCSLALANAIREEYGDDACIILMSGTPSPKSPTDWWHQCEVACPGFLKEGHPNSFKERLCHIESTEGLYGTFPKVKWWWDDERRCAKCGKMVNDPAHDKSFGGCVFKKSTNEVALLNKRLKGLVMIKFKKDCLDLPDKQYQIIKVKPSVTTLRAAKLIRAKSTSSIRALSLLRQLSDGFQYKEVESGTRECPGCNGTGEVEQPVYEGDANFQTNADQPDNVRFEMGECSECGGSGLVPDYNRVADSVSSPKDEVFTELLDEHSDIGRFVVWGGFQGTIDRLIGLAHQQGWATLRVDGRGYVATDPNNQSLSDERLLDAMDLSHPDYESLKQEFPRVCFVGHPGAGGMALTLTSSPTSLFYSNDFSGEARMQSEDRIHRAGMDTNRGATIIDIIHLPSDQLVLDNLAKKKKLQNITLGEIEDAWNSMPEEETRND